MVQRKHKISKRHSKKRSMRSKQRGGDDGRYVLPGAYFGNGTSGYSSAGGFACGSKQLAVSDGVIHPDGKFAGPNLYPQQAGSRRRQTKKNNKNANKRNNKGRTCRSARKH